MVLAGGFVGRGPTFSTQSIQGTNGTMQNKKKPSLKKKWLSFKSWRANLH